MQTQRPKFIPSWKQCLFGVHVRFLWHRWSQNNFNATFLVKYKKKWKNDVPHAMWDSARDIHSWRAASRPQKTTGLPLKLAEYCENFSNFVFKHGILHYSFLIGKIWLKNRGIFFVSSSSTQYESSYDNFSRFIEVKKSPAMDRNFC